jgi:hypothetical protein
MTSLSTPSGRWPALVGALRAGALLGLLTLAMPAPATAESSLRNQRFCEVIAVNQEGLSASIRVYSTTGLNRCPQEQWAALDAKAIQKQLGVKALKLNGPRVWVVDGIEIKGTKNAPEVVTFGALPTTLRASLETKLWDLNLNDKPYVTSKVNREGTLLYRAGESVFELQAPEGETYIMQSFSNSVDQKQSLASLAHLGRRLKLPSGWNFQTRILAQDYRLHLSGASYVLNDELANTYLRRPAP